MRKSGFLAGLVLMGAAAGALAQQPEPVEPAEQQEEARPASPRQPIASGEPVRKIRVLQDPYQLASFYRSRQGEGFFGNAEPAPLGNVRENPYAIAGYYRSRQGTGYGYSQFWVNGYGGSYGGRGRGLGYGRRIGTHGDLFLIAPTILAPIGPLRGFWDLDR